VPGLRDEPGGDLLHSRRAQAPGVAADVAATGLAAQIEHRRIGGTAHGQVVLDVLGEGPVEAEPGGQRGVGGVGRGVGGTVLGRDTGRIGGQCVEEEAEIGALPALHKQFGQRRDRVEGEVPQVGVGDDLAPRINSGDDHVDDDDRRGVVVAAQVGVADHAADVVADDHRAVEAELPGQAVDDARQRPFGAVRAGADGRPYARQVDRDGAEVPGGQLHDRPPLGPALRPPVQEDQRPRLRVP
jgi:hypothetical protein